MMIGLVLLLAFTAAADFVYNGGEVFISYFQKFAPRSENASFAEDVRYTYDNKDGYLHVYVNGQEKILKLETEEKSIEELSSGIDEMIIENTSGNISLINTGDEKVKIVVTKSVGVEENEIGQELLNKVSTDVEKRGHTLSIKTSAQNDPKFYNVHYRIYVPQNLKVFDVQTAGGNIRATGVPGMLKLHTSGGDIELKDVSLEGESDINTFGGNITGDIKLNNARNVNITSAGGNIKLKLPGDSKMDLTTETNAGTISGDFFDGSHMGKIDKKINGGGISVKIGTNAGNIVLKKQ